MSDQDQRSASLFSTMVEHAQAGDRNAFVSLITHFKGSVHGYLKRLIGDDEMATDIWSETVCKAWKSLPSTDEGLRAEPRARRWFFTIATNLANDHFKYLEHLHPVSLEYIEELRQTGSTKATKDWERIESTSYKSTEEILCENEHIVFNQKIVDIAIEGVSPQYLLCFHMKYVRDFPHRKIAHDLGISESCSRAYACRGRKQFFQAVAQLRNNLEREDG